MNDRHLSMFLAEELKDFSQKCDRVWTQQKVLALLICPCTFGQQVLQMQGGSSLFCLPVFCHGYRFCMGFAAIQAHLQKFVDPASIRQGDGRKGSAVQAAAIERLRIEVEFSFRKDVSLTCQPISCVS